MGRNRRLDAIQLGEQIEVGVRVLHLDPMMPSARVDENVGRGNRPPAAARPTREIERRPPYVVVNGEARKHAVVIPQRPALLLVTDTRPDLEADHRAPYSVSRSQEGFDTGTHEWITFRAHLMNPCRGIDELHLRTRPECSCSNASIWSFDSNEPKLPEYLARAAMRRRRLKSSMAVTMASLLVFARVNRTKSRSAPSGISTVVFMIPG